MAVPRFLRTHLMTSRKVEMGGICVLDDLSHLKCPAWERHITVANSKVHRKKEQMERVWKCQPSPLTLLQTPHPQTQMLSHPARIPVKPPPQELAFTQTSSLLKDNGSKFPLLKYLRR